MAKRLRITGLVQGVGYRLSFQTQARTLKLSGWVRNRLDGSVEAVIHGDAQAMQEILEWTRLGPPGASVREITVEDIDESSVNPGNFERLPTC